MKSMYELSDLPSEVIPGGGIIGRQLELLLGICNLSFYILLRSRFASFEHRKPAVVPSGVVAHIRSKQMFGKFQLS